MPVINVGKASLADRLQVEAVIDEEVGLAGVRLGGLLIPALLRFDGVDDRVPEPAGDLKGGDPAGVDRNKVLAKRPECHALAGDDQVGGRLGWFGQLSPPGRAHRGAYGRRVTTLAVDAADAIGHCIARVVLQAEDAPAGGRPQARGWEVDSGRASLRRAWRPHPYHSCCRAPLVEGAEVKRSGVSVVERGEPVASCSEWHADGTAGEDGLGSGLAAVVPAR